MNKIRVLIADDHNLFRSGIISMLETSAEILIIGEASDGAEVYDKYFLLNPDVCLVDISMPVMSGTEAATKILERDKSAKILFLSMHAGDEYIYLCLKAGGKGLINKNVLKAELVEAIKLVNNGAEYFGADVNEKVLLNILHTFNMIPKQPIITEFQNLSDREKELLNLISKGLTSQAMADCLFLSKRTIDAYRAKLMMKLNLNSYAELMNYAVRTMITTDTNKII